MIERTDLTEEFVVSLTERELLLVRRQIDRKIEKIEDLHGDRTGRPGRWFHEIHPHAAEYYRVLEKVQDCLNNIYRRTMERTK